MPKENRKRGRREEQKKRKRAEVDHESKSKRRRRSVDEAQNEEHNGEPYEDEAIHGVARPGAMPFYGMLDSEEQEYFRKADEMLELNQFSDPEQRSIFLESVYKEAEGKELKIANSQSCSRLLERLILLSTPGQTKALFKKFSSQ